MNSSGNVPGIQDCSTAPRAIWRYADQHYESGAEPELMGIVNVTPDSFSDGGRLGDVESAVAHALGLERDGAGFLDVGGESTRPGAVPVPFEEERRRVIPVIAALARQTSLAISVDTTKAEIARLAIEAGAAIVNDISGLTFDPRMLAVCRDAGAGVICMHIQGTPQTMQTDPRYDDVVGEIVEYFERRLEALDAAGIPPERVVLDPGIGFGKTAEHNVAILSNVARFRALGRPVLIGHSRKRFLSRLLGRAAEERTAATIGVSIALAGQSTDILRVHDVAANRDALAAWRAIRGA
ncbi:MAG TPA: dihydropteroate synthase [Planctomycetaceae bacterium]|nr:dihydropteroate synthase [Planctomycetaceae bacterium]